MKSVYSSLTKKRPSSRSHVALQTASRTPADLEELYWFAMALTGDREFAASLVADTAKLPPSGRGILHD